MGGADTGICPATDGVILTYTLGGGEGKGGQLQTVSKHGNTPRRIPAYEIRFEVKYEVKG
jgi:hypothetical protein